MESQLEMDFKKTLFISYSGGRTSAFLVEKLLENHSHEYNFIILYANTGQEHDDTLLFVHQCEKRWLERHGVQVVWLEAVVNPKKGEGTRHRIVSYETATRRTDVGPDTPFAQVIAKYGLPGPGTPQICTRELKGAVMRSYTRDYEKAHKTKCYTAIGMRADEPRRIMSEADKSKYRVVYPLFDWFPTTKADVLDYWEDQDFDLKIPEHLGNCVTCWKKSKAKHIRIVKEHPEYYQFFSLMEKQHENTNNKEGYEPRRFFRESRTVNDLFALAERTPIHNIPVTINEEFDGCSESCEAATPEALGLADE
jgi:3'-phosphoadenosine 5'-phosphosulfate sulfotransferase (PAPS reductase)/FAD synthetase